MTAHRITVWGLNPMILDMRACMLGERTHTAAANRNEGLDTRVFAERYVQSVFPLSKCARHNYLTTNPEVRGDGQRVPNVPHAQGRRRGGGSLGQQ